MTFMMIESADFNFAIILVWVVGLVTGWALSTYEEQVKKFLREFLMRIDEVWSHE